MKTYKDQQGRFITVDQFGGKFISDALGNPLRDEEGFVTFVDVVLG